MLVFTSRKTTRMENAERDCQQHQDKFKKSDALTSADAIKRVEYMWKVHVYKVISLLKSDRSKKKELSDFLLEQIGFFQGLLGTLQVFPHSDPDDIINGRSSLSLIKGPQSSGKGKKQRPKAHLVPTPKELELIARLHIYIGDLFRYKANYQNALLYYAKSTRFNSTSWAFNQMGVVYHSLKDLTLAKHFYIRAIYHPDPFPSSRDNLARLKDVLEGDSESDLSDIAMNAVAYCKYRSAVSLLNTFGLAKTFGNLNSSGELQTFLATMKPYLDDSWANADSDEESLYLRIFSIFILACLSLNSTVDSKARNVFLANNLPLFTANRVAEGREITVPEELGKDLKYFSLFETLKFKCGKKKTLLQDTLKEITMILTEKHGGQIESKSTPTNTVETHQLSAEFTQAQRKDSEDDVVLFKGRSSMSSKASSPGIGAAKMENIVRRSMSLSKRGSPIGSERRMMSAVGRNAAGSSFPNGVTMRDLDGYLLFPPANNASLWNSSRPGAEISPSDPIVNLGSRMSFSGLQTKDQQT